MNPETVREIENIYRQIPWATEKRLRTLSEKPTAQALLRYARALIDSPENYTSRPAALTHEGRPAFATDPEAVSFNVHGARERAARTLDAGGPELDATRRSLKGSTSDPPRSAATTRPTQPRSPRSRRQPDSLPDACSAAQATRIQRRSLPLHAELADS